MQTLNMSLHRRFVLSVCPLHLPLVHSQIDYLEIKIYFYHENIVIDNETNEEFSIGIYEKAILMCRK